MNELNKLIEESRKMFKAMTPEQRDEMFRRQMESWVRAEVSWPKPNYHYENGVKVYDSYEDYCNG